jgi:hypothetical protein
MQSKAPHLRELIMRPPPDYQLQDPILRAAEARGIAVGEARGIVLGEARGEARGRVALLTRQLESRFGKIEPAIGKRLEHATPADLERWADRILTAKSLDAVFADDPS